MRYVCLICGWVSKIRMADRWEPYPAGRPKTRETTRMQTTPIGKLQAYSDKMVGIVNNNPPFADNVCVDAVLVHLNRLADYDDKQAAAAQFARVMPSVRRVLDNMATNIDKEKIFACKREIMCIRNTPAEVNVDCVVCMSTAGTDFKWCVKYPCNHTLCVTCAITYVWDRCVYCRQPVDVMV